ncbi:cytochrome P450 [Podospora didyma]|uniref:Cytochrome P450 n=1 Tax=Podospora didyma TaxID=330526 RepID=A0AAE0N4P0_9PEZI|nr:cytochrome P450 [Podospora didyma]
MSSTLVFVTLGASAAVWLIFKRTKQPKLPPGIPYVEFEDGDNSNERYFLETRSVTTRGYNKYIKNGQPFSMHNAANTDLPLLVLPHKYLDEVKNAQDHQLNLPKVLDQRAGMDKIGGFLLTDETVSVVRTAMSRAITQLVPGMDEKCIMAYKEFMPPCPDWTPTNPFQLLLKVWTRMISHVMVGPQLSQSDEWLNEMMTFIPTVMAASFALRSYRKSMYWTAKYIQPEIKELYRLRGRVAKLLTPLLEERIAIRAKNRATSGKKKDLHADAVQWFVDEYDVKGLKPRADHLARDMLMLSLVSFLSTAATCLGIIYDMMDRPDSFKEICDEMTRVRKEHDGKVTRQSLAQLVVLDSFMKEGQRTNPINQISMDRLALQDYTFKDGLKIAAGVDVAFANELISEDPAHWGPDAAEFDPHRFLRKRQQQEGKLSQSFQVTSITDDMMPFGNGPHACPGRFLASDGMKMMIMNLIYRYEFKYPEGVTERPENNKGHHTMLPNMKMDMLFREKTTLGFS